MQSTKLLTVVFSMIIFTGITASNAAFAESDVQKTLDSIAEIEFRTMTDFHTYLPDSQISFNVSCNQLAGEFAIGFNTSIQKSDGSPADVNDVRNLVFLQRGSSDLGAFIDAVNTGSDRLKLTVEVSCAKLLPVSLPTVPDVPTEFSVVTGDQQSTLTWEEPLFDGESLITKYQISAMPDPRTAAAGNVFAETEDTSFTFGGLVSGITYKFQVNAVNDVGPGILSEIITGTPLAPYVPTPVPIPTLTSEKISVCHNDKVTLHLPSQAVRVHLENHGDYLGECSDITIPPLNPTSTISNVSFSYPTSPEPNDQEAKILQREADKAQREADRLAKQEADKAQREADRLAKQEAKILQIEADKAQREADRLAKQEAKNTQNNSTKDK